MILKGSVSINGTYVRDLSRRVLPEDDVRVHGRSVRTIAPRTLLLNKPAGYTTTRSDRHAERTIFDLLPSDCGHLFHVGRLDRESEGLLLVTNDGALAQELMHPSKGVEKEYEVIVDRPFSQRDAAALLKGTWIEGSVARVESVRILAPTKISLILHQGLKRQIRVMLGLIGFKVQRLIRIRLGPLTLRGIKPGSYREIRPEDLTALRKAIAAPKPKRAPAPAKPKPKALTFTNFTVIPASEKPRGAARPGSSPSPRKGVRSDRTSAAKPARKTSPTTARMRKPKA